MGRLQKGKVTACGRQAGTHSGPFCQSGPSSSLKTTLSPMATYDLYNRLAKGISIPCTDGETEAQSERTHTSFPPALRSGGVVPGVVSVLPLRGWAPGGCSEQGLGGEGGQSALRAHRGVHCQRSGAAAAETVETAPPAAPAPSCLPLRRPGRPHELPRWPWNPFPDLSLSRSPAHLWVRVP